MDRPEAWWRACRAVHALSMIVGPWHRSIMTIPDRTRCEVRIGGAWQLVPLAEAHAHHRNALKRCPTCHGRVRTQGVYSGQGGVAMMHHNAHDGCSRIPKQYAGTPKRHPEALD